MDVLYHSNHQIDTNIFKIFVSSYSFLRPHLGRTQLRDSFDIRHQGQLLDIAIVLGVV